MAARLQTIYCSLKIVIVLVEESLEYVPKGPTYK